MQGTLEIAEACAKEKRPYMHDVCGKDFVVLPGVFSPKYFRDTAFFAREVPKRAGKSFLEIGTGTGIVACFAAMSSGREVVATDISGPAVRNARINALLHEIEHYVSVRHGSIYGPVRRQNRGAEIFDTIFWNVPFGDWRTESPSRLTKSVFDPEQACLKQYIRGAPQHLRSKDSNLLIGYSTTLGKYPILERLLDEAGFAPPEVVAESGYVRDGNPRRPVDFKLFEARMK